MMRSKGILGLNLLRLADDRPEILGRALEAVMALAAGGTLMPVVDREFPADRVAEAHAHVESRSSIGKVILRWE
jgi:NADPH2:quinone reductase